MVAFIVTVKVVENNVNSRVGREKVASFRTKYRSDETRCNTPRISLAKRPAQEKESCVTTTPLAVVIAGARAGVAAPTAEERAWETLVAFDGSMSGCRALPLQPLHHSGEWASDSCRALKKPVHTRAERRERHGLGVLCWIRQREAVAGRPRGPASGQSGWERLHVAVWFTCQRGKEGKALRSSQGFGLPGFTGQDVRERAPVGSISLVDARAADG